MCAWLGFIYYRIFLLIHYYLSLCQIFIHSLRLFPWQEWYRHYSSLVWWWCWWWLLLLLLFIYLSISVSFTLRYFFLAFPFLYVYSSLFQVLLDILYCSPSLGRNYLSLVSVFWWFLHRFFFLYTNNSIIWTQQLTFSSRI